MKRDKETKWKIYIKYCNNIQKLQMGDTRLLHSKHTNSINKFCGHFFS